MNLLVKPRSFTMCSRTSTPLGLMYIAAMDNSAEIVDLAIDKKINIRGYINEHRPEVVGVQVYTPGRGESFRILQQAKEDTGCITVAGGPHVAVMRRQIEKFDFIDHLVIGDGEYAWKEIVGNRDKEDGPKRTIRQLVSNLDELPLPAWEKIRTSRYSKNRISVVLGRGCDGKCTFCSAWWVNGAYRHHSGEWLLEHLNKIARHSHSKILIFQDDCLTNTDSGYDALVTALRQFRKRHKWKFIGTTRIDRITKEQVFELKSLGFVQLAFGIENGSQEILEKINKQTDLSQAFRVRKWFKEADLSFKALMMTGFPFETPETRKEDTAFRVALQPDEWGSIGHIAVFPGTKLYRDMKKEGAISDDFWLGEEPYYKIG